MARSIWSGTISFGHIDNFRTRSPNAGGAECAPLQRELPGLGP